MIRYTFAGNGNVIVMELFQSQSSRNGSWHRFAIGITLCNYLATTDGYL